MSGMAKSNDKLWFQSAKIINSWEPSDPGSLGIFRMVGFFTEKVVDRLTVIRFKDGVGNQWITAAYTHVTFKVPEAWEDFLINKNK